MKVLVGCEFSGVVRDAFIARGHDAMSCDLLDTEVPGPHYQGDIRDVLGDEWDLGIFFPPCTYLTVSANKWYRDQPPRKSGVLVGAQRRQAREEAINFFAMLMKAPIKRKCAENPVGVLSSRYRKPDQIIQPWQFGHGETKATCLWLESLPKLMPTQIVQGREQRVFTESPGPERWKARSKTYPGVAEAMAEQWGNLTNIED